MDSAYFQQIERLFSQASRYMGGTWRRTVATSLAALQADLEKLSALAADNLELAVNAESQLAAMRREVDAFKASETEVKEVVTETVVSTPEATVTETVVSTESEAKVEPQIT